MAVRILALLSQGRRQTGISLCLLERKTDSCLALKAWEGAKRRWFSPCCSKSRSTLSPLQMDFTSASNGMSKAPFEKGHQSLLPSAFWRILTVERTLCHYYTAVTKITARALLDHKICYTRKWWKLCSNLLCWPNYPKSGFDLLSMALHYTEFSHIRFPGIGGRKSLRNVRSWKKIITQVINDTLRLLVWLVHLCNHVWSYILFFTSTLHSHL